MLVPQQLLQQVQHQEMQQRQISSVDNCDIQSPDMRLWLARLGLITANITDTITANITANFAANITASITAIIMANITANLSLSPSTAGQTAIALTKLREPIDTRREVEKEEDEKEEKEVEEREEEVQ